MRLRKAPSSTVMLICREKYKNNNKKKNTGGIFENATSPLYWRTDNTLQHYWLLCHMTDHRRINKYVPCLQQVNLST